MDWAETVLRDWREEDQKRYWESVRLRETTTTNAVAGYDASLGVKKPKPRDDEEDEKKKKKESRIGKAVSEAIELGATRAACCCLAERLVLGVEDNMQRRKREEPDLVC